MGQKVKNLPVMWETGVQSLSQENSLEKGMATHSSIFAWRIPWTEEPGGLQSMGSQRVRHDWAASTQTHTEWPAQNLANDMYLTNTIYTRFFIYSWALYILHSDLRRRNKDSTQKFKALIETKRVSRSSRGGRKEEEEKFWGSLETKPVWMTQ